MGDLSDRFTELARSGPGFSLALVVVLLLAGLLFLVLGWRVDHLPELGVGLMVGGLFALASYANQVTVQVSEFRSSLAISRDLSGFESNGFDLSELNFSGKKLWAADLSGEDLHDARFNYADLREASLRDVKARGATFFYATFLRADLTGAHLDRTDLEGAEISTPSIAGATFRGARVNGTTCWNVTFEDVDGLVPDESGREVLDRVLDAGLDPGFGHVLGRACERHEVGSAQKDLVTDDEERSILICTEEPYLTREDSCP